jgi:hypothetical protein
VSYLLSGRLDLEKMFLCIGARWQRGAVQADQLDRSESGDLAAM